MTGCFSFISALACLTEEVKYGPEDTEELEQPFVCNKAS